MARRNLKKELGDAEFDEIDRLLRRVRGGEIANVEAFDGFLTALVISPELVMPSEYMAAITSGETEDDDLVFESLEEATRFNELVSRHWNAINWTFRSGEFYMPVLAESEDGTSLGNDWAKGFLRGAYMRFEPWSEIMEDEERAGVLVPLLALAHEHNPDPEIRPYKEPISQELRTELLAGMIAGVRRIYDMFELQRKAGAANPSSVGTYRRTSPKVGRNQPCPCGSGKKFKHCCGRVTVH